MWELNNKTPYAADRAWVQDKDGRKHWIVVVRGTFDILPDGTTTVAQEQLPPNAAPVYSGDEGRSSLLYEADLVAAKPGTDVVVNGSAHAPHGRATTACSVRLKIADRDKVLEVVGDRTYARALTGQVSPSSAVPFVTMPITYERAYGGYDDEDADPSKHTLFAPNPIGIGVHKGALLLGKVAPNIALPSGGGKVAAGFGAVASHWHPRSTFAGTYDGAWIENRKPLLPQDWDPRVLLCAPADQQFIPHLNGGEIIELHGMTPSGAMRVTIPRADLTFKTRVRGSDKRTRGSLVSVVVEPDAQRVLVAWQTSLPCHHDMDYLEFTSIFEAGAAP